MDKLGRFEDNLLDRQITEIERFCKRPVIRDPGEGIIVTTPDGTATYRIRVDNAGALVIEAANV